MAEHKLANRTEEEMKSVARSCICGARSENELRTRLSEAGFDGQSADIDWREPEEANGFSGTCMHLTLYDPLKTDGSFFSV